MKPFVILDEQVLELTVRSVLLAIVLTIVLAISNAYLALKLGILTSASIPAAIVSMGILRLFKQPSILENNSVQTAASAGEAVAGGIVYTIPALIIIQYWHHFDYLTNFFIAFSGGTLGVLFSIPLRRILVHDKALKFPEGRAIAEVLQSSSETIGIRDLIYGSIIGAVFELCQVGFKIIANSWTHWFVIKRSIVGLGAGFSATMIGAGFLIGFDMALSIFLGAIISWCIALPLVSHGLSLTHVSLAETASFLWNNQLRYLGIGAMLFAGVWTFVKLIKPLAHNIYSSLRFFSSKSSNSQEVLRTEKDISVPFIFIGVILIAVLLFLFFQFIFPLDEIGLNGDFSPSLLFGAVIYVLVIGFLFAVITAYFSGMVGVTASPGSSIVIAGILFASWLLLSVIHYVIPLPLTSQQLVAAEAIIIIIASVVTGIAAIANDNTQDLKVGQLVGATPWKQQIMLLLGVLVSSLVIPLVMQLLFDVYGIAGVMPHEGMDASQSLPAPVAALLAAITQSVFHNRIPWDMMLVGGGIILLLIISIRVFKIQRFCQLSILGVAMGMYLPIASSFPLFLGGLIAWWVKRRLYQANDSSSAIKLRQQVGTRIACGLVAGAALLDVLLALVFSIYKSPDALCFVGKGWDVYALLLAILSTGWLAKWMRTRITS